MDQESNGFPLSDGNEDSDFWDTDIEDDGGINFHGSLS